MHRLNGIRPDIRPDIRPSVRNAFHFALCLGIIAAGCDSSDPRPLTDEEYDDVANTLGSVVTGTGGGGDVYNLTSAANLAIGNMPFGAHLDASGSVKGNTAGVEFDFSLVCDDAQGQALAPCDETTDSAEITLELMGSVQIPPHFSATVDGSGDWSVSGIASGVATIDGKNTLTVDSHFQGGLLAPSTRDYHVSYSASVDGIRVDLIPLGIIGGQIRYSLDVDRHVVTPDHDARSSYDVDAVLTFHADGSATLVLDGVRTYDVDTLHGTVTLHVGT